MNRSKLTNIPVNLIGILFIIFFSCNRNNKQEVPTIQVQQGIFLEELLEEGTLQAVHSINVNAPRISYRFGALKIANIVEDGSEVQKGDTLLIFDPSDVRKSIIEIQQRLDIQEAELDKMLATQQSEIEDLEADFEISRIDLEISGINFEQSVHEAEITKKEIQLKLENARLALERAGEQIENKKEIHKVDLFQKNINIGQLNEQLREAKETIDDLILVSPANGIAIIESNWMTQQKWQAGDQPYSGSKIIVLPDLDEMKVDVSINEVDALKISMGLPVTIAPDAFSDNVYFGEIIRMANLAQKRDRNTNIKVFPLEISISDSDEHLMPGLTVSCRIKISEQPDALLIPLDAVFRDEVNEYVYIKTGTGFKRRNIKIARYNSDFASIEEGLKENEEIALSDPFLNKHKEKDENAPSDNSNI